MERVRRLPRAERPRDETAVATLPVDVSLENTTDAQVIYGASVQTMPLAGLTVAQAREVAMSVLRVDPRAPVLINGEPASPERRVEAGATVEFVHHSGEKGSR